MIPNNVLKSALAGPGGYVAFPDQDGVTIVAPSRVWTLSKNETRALIHRLTECVGTE